MRYLMMVTVVGGLLGSAVDAWAGNFNHSADAVIGPDFISGTAFGRGDGERAVTTHVESSFQYWLNPGLGTLNFFATFTAEGVWGDPLSTSPYYDWLQTQGLHSQLLFQMASFDWDGKVYALDSPVFFWSDGVARLDRNIQYEWLQGYFNNVASCLNAIPTAVSSRALLFNPGHPAGVPDWEIQFTSSWLVTSRYYLAPIPEPLTASLIALGYLMLRKRLWHH